MALNGTRNRSRGLDELEQCCRAGERVGREATGPHLALQTTLAHPPEPALGLHAGGHFNVDVEGRGKLLGQPVDAGQLLGLALDCVNDGLMTHGRSVEAGDSVAIDLGTVTNDGTQPPVTGRSGGCQRFGEFRQSRGGEHETA